MNLQNIVKCGFYLPITLFVRDGFAADMDKKTMTTRDVTRFAIFLRPEFRHIFGLCSKMHRQVVKEGENSPEKIREFPVD